MSNVKKIGIIGTSSSGKTTLCYEVLWKLKRAGVLCDGVLQQDRRFTFDRALLETDPLAQWSFISNQIKNEADMAMRPGVDILVSDRSPLDLYAYYVATHGPNENLQAAVMDWCETTFEKLYMLRPVKYEDDKVRPSEKFRDSVNTILISLLFDSYQGRNIEIEPIGIAQAKVWRQNIPNAILNIAGKTLKEDDLSIIPDILDVSVLIGGSYAFNRATKWSDVDVYMWKALTDHRTLEYCKEKVQKILGVQVDLNFISDDRVWNYLMVQGFRLYARKE